MDKTRLQRLFERVKNKLKDWTIGRREKRRVLSEERCKGMRPAGGKAVRPPAAAAPTASAKEVKGNNAMLERSKQIAREVREQGVTEAGHGARQPPTGKGPPSKGRGR